MIALFLDLLEMINSAFTMVTRILLLKETLKAKIRQDEDYNENDEDTFIKNIEDY